LIKIVWEFSVHPSRIAEFESSYGSEGDWARLFARSPHYKGTTLLRHTDHTNRFLTIDLWDDRASFDAFKHQNGTEYTSLDLRCEELTDEEECIGTFEVV